VIGPGRRARDPRAPAPGDQLTLESTELRLVRGVGKFAVRASVGDALVAGAHFGRVRAMHDFIGSKVKRATPGEPVEMLGFDGVPEAGDH